MRFQDSVLTARSLMSSPVRTVLSSATIEAAQKALSRYGHSGLCVINTDESLAGVVADRDLEVAIRHGLGDEPITRCLSIPLKTVSPNASFADIQWLAETYGVSHIPVLDDNQVVGIITRTDIAAVSPPPAQVLYQQLAVRLPTIWPALQLIAAAAEAEGWALYTVGGVVRDLLLSLSGQSYPLVDIDLVVEGGADPAEGADAAGDADAAEGAGVMLAELVRSHYPDVKLHIYGQFQTATLTWPSPPLLIDIATARTERYPYPAANPEVAASTIYQDLQRRDFAVNAMALRLNGPLAGQLLDFFGGWQDLHQKQIRVLHVNSFVEDPTRIFRAVRFATRLGFSLEPRTEQLIREVICSGLYTKLQNQTDKVPALQSRLQAELQSLLTSEHWQRALAQTDELGALACLHPSLTLTPDIWKQLRRAARWLSKFDVRVPRWLMFLELIIAQLSSAVAGTVAERLGLGEKSCYRLQNLRHWEANCLQQLPNASKPSQRYRLFYSRSHVELLLMANRHPYTLGPHIWHYIVWLSQMSPLINGDTLKRLGYPPGPQFREILNDVHQRQLDGELSNAQSAEHYVLAHYHQ